MVLDEEEQERANATNNPRARNAIRNHNQKWPGGIVPYVLGAEFDNDYDRAIIMKAMRIYQENTCIRFVYHHQISH